MGFISILSDTNQTADLNNYCGSASASGQRVVRCPNITAAQSGLQAAAL